MTISPQISEFFERRGIDPETATRLGITSEKRGGGTVIVFPVVENGETVNNKYRGRGKRFTQDPDARKTFWNSDAIELAKQQDRPLVITEGEMDALSAIEAGYPFVVSVPDGAPKEAIEDLDAQKFSYIRNNRERLDDVREIILAGDGDEPGKILNAELVRRLGVHRCRFIEYPAPADGFDQCKDLNDVLVQYGAKAVLDLITAAKPYPVAGLYTFDDFPDLPKPAVYSTGLPCMDKHMMLELGRFGVWTGIPGHGKSEMLDTVILNTARLHDWHWCVATFENQPRPHWERNILRKLCEADPDFAKPEKVQLARAFMHKHFSFICQNPTNVDDEDLTIDKIIENAEISVIRHGTKGLAIDPWNEVEHQRERGESEHDYIGNAIRKLKRFARTWNVFVAVVVHPTKMNQNGDIKRPHPYDAAGSSHWYNKADYFTTVWRPDIIKDVVEAHVQKIKIHGYMGKPGAVDLQFNRQTGGYQQYLSPGDMQ